MSYNRGGKESAYYSEKYFWGLVCAPLWIKPGEEPADWSVNGRADLFEGVENPFTQINILSNGLCGSSCDTSTFTSHMTSMLTENSIW